MFGSMRAPLHPELARMLGSMCAPTQQDLSMSFWHVLSSGSIGAHSHNQLAEGGGGEGEGGVAPLLESRDPHLAGWEMVISPCFNPV